MNEQRVESVKAGTIGALCVGLSWSIGSVLHLPIANLINKLLASKYFQIHSDFNINTVDWHLWLSGGIAIFCGLLFGVTYRYIIREDENPHLKTGGVLAFGLVRGLTQVEMGLNGNENVFPLVVLGIESILGFVVAGFMLNIAMRWGWVKAFR